MSLLEAKTVTVRFHGHDDQGRRGSLAAVDGISLSIARGERIGLIGESGSGKTTLSKALLGLEPLASGEVLFQGQPVSRLKGTALEAFRRGAQMVFQDHWGSLNPRQTAGAAIGEVLAVHRLVPKADRAGKVAELLHQVGLDAGYAGRYPHEFSGGQRQRVGIARALAMDPALMVADEPVSALDVSVQAQILNLIRDLSEQRGMAILLVAHDLAVVNYVCDRVLILYRGSVVEEGATRDVFAAPAHPYTRLLKASVPDPDDSPAPAAGSRSAGVGAPPPQGLPPGGCRFAPRCPEATPECLAAVPVLAPRQDGRSVACIHPVA